MKTIVVHKFRMSDVEDPDLWAAQVLYEWEQSEKGRWIMKNTIDPTWSRHVDYNSYGWQYVITAKMSDEQVTYYKLKYE